MVETCYEDLRSQTYMSSFSEAVPDRECVCAPGVVQKYLNKISGPLLDRIDLHVEVTPVGIEEISNNERTGESSFEIRQRVIKSRAIQSKRFKDQHSVVCNAQMSPQMTREVCKINKPAQLLLNKAMEKLDLSARAYDRILKVSRTIADLAASDDIQMEHLAEAIQYRSLDRESWSQG